MTKKRKNKNAGGRLSKLKPELITELEVYFSNGATVKDSCAHAGVSERVYYYWMKTGREELARLDTNDGRVKPKESLQPYVQFFQRMKKAQSTMRMTALDHILEHAKHHWQAAAWLLERSDPENWGRRKVDADVSGELIVKVVREKKPIRK